MTGHNTSLTLRHDLELVPCPPYAARLTAKACAGFYLLANERRRQSRGNGNRGNLQHSPMVGEVGPPGYSVDRERCVGCQVGKERAARLGMVKAALAPERPKSTVGLPLDYSLRQPGRAQGRRPKASTWDKRARPPEAQTSAPKRDAVKRPATARDVVRRVKPKPRKKIAAKKVRRMSATCPRNVRGGLTLGRRKSGG